MCRCGPVWAAAGSARSQSWFGSSRNLLDRLSWMAGIAARAGVPTSAAILSTGVFRRRGGGAACLAPCASEMI